MGKTKTAFISEAAGEKSGKEAYEEKRKRKEEEAKKAQVTGVGLKGGERIKVISGEAIVEESTQEKKETKTKKVRVRGKKYKEALTKIDKSKTYPLVKALELIKETSYTKFDATVELHLTLRKENVSADVVLPYSGGKQKKIEIVDDATIEKLKAGKVDADILLATSDMMPRLVPFAKILGPRGLMPNPKNGTLIKDKKDAEKFSGNNVRIKTEKKQPIIHVSVGKISQKTEELKANIQAVLDAVNPKIIERAYVSATMSPSVKLTL